MEEIKYGFRNSVPVLFGYLFLGSAFGILLQRSGYNFIWAFFISLFAYSGSTQFMLVSFLKDGTSAVVVLILTLFVNSRHMFYGLTFIEKFKKLGKKYPYMIFSLTDETYSVLSCYRYPKWVNEGEASFYTALFDHIYWITGGIIGSLLGEFIPFDFKGIDFSMTALFVILFIEQWKNQKSHMPIYIGGISGFLFLIIMGPEKFILPSLLVTVGFLLLFRKTIDEEEMKGA